MAAKAKLTPDFSKALPPKNAMGLEVSTAQILTILKRKPGRLYTTSEILVLLKEDINVWDNHAAVIGAANMLIERHKVEAGSIQLDAKWHPAWMVPKPKEEELTAAANPEKTSPLEFTRAFASQDVVKT